MKTFALSALIALAATSALAQATTDQNEYYVVLDPETKKCIVVEQEPADTTILGVFKALIDADAGI